MQTPLHVLFERYPWSSWEEVELEGALRYLRGCKGLGIPPSFRAVIPTAL